MVIVHSSEPVSVADISADATQTIRQVMTKREQIHTELKALYKTGAELAVSFQQKKDKQFHSDYHSWYAVALKAV